MSTRRRLTYPCATDGAIAASFEDADGNISEVIVQDQTLLDALTSTPAMIPNPAHQALVEQAWQAAEQVGG